MSKRTTAVVISVLVAGLVVWFTASAMAGSDQGPSAKPARTITVSATATVKAQPDEAVVNLGVRSESPDSTHAMSQNAADMQAVLDALKSAGIEQKDIQTLNLSLGQQVRNPGKKNEQKVFVASNSVQVTIHDLSSVGGVIDAAVQAGADSVNDIRFQVSDPNAVRTDALTQAVKSARTKADALAAAADTSVVGVVTINENNFREPFFRAAIPAALPFDQAVKTPVVPPASLEASVTISVVWEIG